MRRPKLQLHNLIYFVGLPLLGKSHISKRVAAYLNITRIENDQVLPLIIPDSDFNEKDRYISYNVLTLLAKYFLILGKDLIIDAAYSNQAKLAERQRILKGVPHRKIHFWIKPDLKIMLRRFQKRNNHPAVDLTVERLTYLYEHHQPPKIENLHILYPEDHKENNVSICLDILKNHYGITKHRNK